MYKVNKPLIGTVALLIWIEGCSVRNPNGALGYVPIEPEVGRPAMTAVRFGTPVQMELLQDLSGHGEGPIKNVRLRVVKSVWVENLMVIEEGAEATGIATIKAPDVATNGELSLEANYAAGITGAGIPLAGGLTAHGTFSDECRYDIGCLVHMFDEGGYAKMSKGRRFVAVVGRSVELPTEALQSFLKKRTAEVNQAIARCDHVATVRVYFPGDGMEDEEQNFPNRYGSNQRPVEQGPKILLDGKEVGRVARSSVLTLVPALGRHVIATKTSFIALDLKQCTPYYVRILDVPPRYKRTPNLEWVAAERGEDEIRGLQEVMNQR